MRILVYDKAGTDAFETISLSVESVSGTLKESCRLNNSLMTRQYQ